MLDLHAGAWAQAASSPKEASTMATVNGNTVSMVNGIETYTTPAGRVYHRHHDANGQLTKWHWATDSHRYTVQGHNATTVNPYALAAVKRVNDMPYSTAVTVAQRKAAAAQANVKARINAAMVAVGASYPKLVAAPAPKRQAKAS